MSLTSCSGVKKLEIFKTEVEREKLNLKKPTPLELEQLRWIIITSENAEEVFKKLEEQGIDPVIFGLTDKDFQLLAKNFARIRNQLKVTNDLLDKYKEYTKRKIMSKNRLDISDNTAISMPVRNMLAIIGAVAVGVWAYFGVLERITMLETKSVLTEKDINQHVERLETEVVKNTEFRIKWPRGEMGSLPADSEQFMLIEDLYGSVEKIDKHIESMADNRINIDFLKKQVEKMMVDIEKLKDANRDLGYKNGQ